MKVGFLHSLIRSEEKLLIRELQARDEIELVLLDDRRIEFEMDHSGFDFDVLLDRSVGYWHSLNALRIFEGFGIRCINSSNTAAKCGDKLHTSVVLRQNGICQPEVRVAFSEQSALSAMEKMGFPVVLKPAIGSWGRLLSRINDRDAARSILDHRKALGTFHHTTYYIQKYVEKKGRDIRCIVVNGECVAAIYRTSEHWITNAARGAGSQICPLSDEIIEISLRVANVVGGDILGIDLFETEDGYLVNEINHTVEFKSCMAATGVDIPGIIADFVSGLARINPLGKQAGGSLLGA